jgi:hypothetical protein
MHLQQHQTLLLLLLLLVWVGLQVTHWVCRLFWPKAAAGRLCPLLLPSQQQVQQPDQQQCPLLGLA